MMINIPGHSDGLCALKITNDEGRYVLLYSDGGYATKSWKEQIPSGIDADGDKLCTFVMKINGDDFLKRCKSFAISCFVK